MKQLFKLCTIALSAAAISQAEAESVPTIWGLRISPYVRKVLVGLETKGIAYDLKEIAPAKVLQAQGQEVPADFAAASPLGKIPAMRDGDFTLSDSSVILSYLEKAYPQHPIYPKDAEQFAKTVWFEKYADTVMTDALYTKIFLERVVKPALLNLPTDQSVVENAIQEDLPKIADYLEKSLKESKGKRLVGNYTTVADIAVGTHFVSLKIAKVDVDANRWPKLSKYLQDLFNEKAFRTVLTLEGTQ